MARQTIMAETLFIETTQLETPKTQLAGEASPTEQLRRQERHLTGIISWSLLLFLTFGVTIAGIAQISAAGPSGAAHPLRAQTQDGATLFSVGQSPDVTARAAFVYDADLGFVYYTKNADLALPQASCTKVMTALLAVERGSLDQVVSVGGDAQAMVRPDSSFMGLAAGEKLSLRELLYGLVLPSGNDAAIAIADAIGGSVPAFVDLMNERAAQLGLTHTHFRNPHGLGEDGHYTTARDLAVLSGVAMRNPKLSQITSTLRYSIPQTNLHKAYDLQTGDDLLAGARAPYPGAIGVKPGFTGDAGYCQSFAAIRHGHLIVGAVLDEPSWQVRIMDMRALLDWGFAQEGIPPAPPINAWSYPKAD